MSRNTGPFENAVDENGQTLFVLGETVPTWPPLTHLQPRHLAAGIATANRTEYDLSSCGQEPRHLACFAFDLAAGDALGKYDERHYNGSTEGKTLARPADRLAAVCRERYHPHVTTCQALRTVALATVGNDVKFARRWLTEKNILRGIPKGHYSDPVAHHFQQAAQFTVRDLAGLPTEDTPAPTAILNRLNSRLNNVGSGGRTVYRDEAISLMGIYGWVKAIKISRTAGDTEEFSNVSKVAAELLQDVYLTPAPAWVRTAYAMRIVERKQPNQ